VNKKSYSIGICLQYDEELYTLAVIRFKQNNDVIIYQPIGHHGRLKNNTNWDTHVTYHGEVGLHHLVSYDKHFLSKNKQKLDSSFSGRENLIVQSFGRDYAKNLKCLCKGFDTCININAEEIKEKVGIVCDHMGKVKTPLPTAFFQVDLIEPNSPDLIDNAVFNAKKLIEQKLIKDSFPWCLVSIFE